MDAGKMETNSPRIVLTLVLLTTFTVCNGQNFTVQTTPNSVSVTWDRSGSFLVRIHDSNMTTCQVEEGQDIRVCASDNLEPATRHDVIVMADNGWTEYYRGTHYTNPLPPREVRWMASYQGTITVEWKRPGQKVMVEGYIMLLVRASNNQTEYQNVVRTRTDKVQRKLYLPSTYGVQYGTAFRLYVWSQYQKVKSVPVVIEVNSAPRPVPQIKSDGTKRNSSSAMVSWSHPDRGSATGYRITARLRKTSSSDISSQMEFNEILPDSPMEYTFTGLAPASTYDLSIWSIYEGVEANMDKTSMFHTSPATVKGLALKYWTTNSATFSWERNNPFHIADFDYMVTAISSSHKTEERVSSSEVGVKISRLRPGNLYTVTVIKKMHQYPRATSEPATVTAQLKPEPVRYIRFSDVTAGSVNTTWSLGYNQQDSFSIKYLGRFVKKQWSKPMITNDPYIVLEGLFPGETYSVGVTALSGGQSSMETTNTVTIVPLPPERLVIQEGSITDRTATVDVIYNASLSYTTEWRVAYGLWSSRLNNYITKSVAVTEANLLRLLPGKKYSVICYGRTTGRLQSQATTSEITFTTRPFFTTRMTSWVTSRSVTITYNYSPQYFDGYTYTLYPGGEQVSKMRYDKGEVTFYNLRPGHLYTVMGQVTSGPMISRGKNITALTKPEVLAACGDTNQTSIQLDMEAPAGLVDEYMVECNPGCSYPATRVKDVEEGATTTYTVRGLHKDTRYEYRVRAVRIVGELRSVSRQRSFFCRTSK